MSKPNPDVGSTVTALYQPYSARPDFLKPAGKRGWYITRSATPNYISARLNGSLPMLPYKMEKSEWSANPVRIVMNPGPPAVTWDMIPIGSASVKAVSADIQNHVVSRALTDVYKHIGDHKTGQFGVSMAEMHKTVGHLASTAVRITTIYRALRKGRVKDALRVLGIHDSDVLRDVVFPKKRRHANGRALRSYLNFVKKSKKPEAFAAHAWLEVTYAWKPLVFDTFDLAKALADRHAAKQMTVTYEGFSSDDTFDALPDLGINSPNWKSGTSIYQVSYGAHYAISNEGVYYTNNLGLQNPATIAWELVPFSFVVDWFVPIGDWLDSFSALAGQTFLAGWRSVKTLHTYTGREQVDSYHPDELGSWFIKTVSFSREVLRSLPGAPVPTFNLRKALSIDHAITSLALMSAIFRGKPNKAAHIELFRS